MAGRRSKITEGVIRDLTDALGIGATIGIACAYANVSQASFHSWDKQGRETLDRLDADPDTELTDLEQKCVRFHRKMEEARAYAAIGWLQVVAEAASHDAGYALRMLKIRYPGEFDEVQRLSHEGTGKDGELVIRIVYGSDGTDSQSA